jgi:membrane-bound inhibitor of C-type lysozyme
MKKLIPMLLLAACAGRPVSSATSMCDGHKVRTKTYDDYTVLKIDGKKSKLSRAVSASGAKYEGVFDGKQTTLWNKGEKFTITMDGKAWPECVGKTKFSKSK